MPRHTMRTSMAIGLAVAASIALAGCESLVTGGDLLRPGEQTGVIEVVNASGMTVDAVLISDCNASTYGLNRLPGGVTIPPGGSHVFTVSAGCWDVDTGVIGYGEARQRMQVPASGGVRYTVS